MNKHFAFALLAACAIAFACGVVWLFELRFAAGDVYPPYSSLRSDPLGAMALYESLDNIPGLSVSRDFRESNELPYEAGTVYLHLGGRSEMWESQPADLYREVTAFLARGGRLVVAFNPETREPWHPPADTSPKNDPKKTTPAKPDPAKPDPGKPNPAKPDSKDKKKTDDSKDKDKADIVSVKDKWGVTFGYVALPTTGDTLVPESVTNASGLSLPATLPWHSGMVFSNLDKSWRTIYARGPDAVIIARQFGPGSVVMVSDSYFFSNEALRSDRHADLLAWLLGSGKQVVFDEAHFGIVESPGIMALVRQYHLIGLLAGLLLLAVLFVWKNFSSLVPPLADERAAYVAGKDSAAGFINLLRRNLPAQDVLGACLAEWRKSAAGPGRKQADVQLVFEAENALPPRQRNSVEAYRRIAAIIKQPSFKPATVVPPPPTL